MQTTAKFTTCPFSLWGLLLAHRSSVPPPQVIRAPGRASSSRRACNRITIAALSIVLFSLFWVCGVHAAPPTLASAIPDTTVSEDNVPIDNYRDLNNVFTDIEDGGALAFSIESNSNPGLVTATIDADSALDLSFAGGQSGIASIIIRATDSGFQSERDTLLVAVSSLAYGDARLSFGEGTVAEVRSRNWDESLGSWLPEVSTTTANSVIKFVVNKISPAGDEELVGVLSDTGAGSDLDLLRWSGATWTVDWSSTAIANANADKRGFDIEYEHVTGEALVVYSDNSATPVYRTRSAGAWSVETLLPLNDGAGPNPDPNTGTVLWVELERRPGTNEITLAYVDANSDLVAIVWDGVQWLTGSADVIETNVKRNPSTGTVSNRVFDLAYEESTGNSMVAWGHDSSPGFWYSTRAAGGNTWSAAAPIASSPSNGESHFIDLASEPSGQRIAIGAFDMGDGVERLGLAMWNGSSWVDGGEYDSQSWDVNDGGTGDFAGAVGWVGKSGTAVVVYPDNQTGTLDWARWTEGSGWVIQADELVTGKGFTESVQLASFSDTDKLMVIFSDSNLDLYAATYDGATWTMANSGAPLETLLSSVDSAPFGFAFEVNEAPTVASAIADTTVTEDNAPIDNYRDLNTVFTDIEDGSALSFTIQSNSNPGLVSVVIDADSALDLAFTPEQSGGATIVVRATDSGSSWIEDTVIVSVITGPALIDSAATSYPTETFVADPALALRIGLNNLTTVGVMLDTTSSIVLSDSSTTYSARLANPTYIPPDARGFTVTFVAAPVSAALTAEASYDFKLLLQGVDDNALTYADTLLTLGRNSIFIDVPKVNVSAIPLQTEPVQPGTRNRELLALHFESEYATDRSLDTLVIYNFSSGPGSQAQLDNEVETLYVFDDVDSSLGLSGPDTLVAQGNLASGRATFVTAGGWRVPGASGRALVVTADIDSFAARDSDRVDAALVSPYDVVFEAGTVVEQDFSPIDPLNSFGNLVVDGMVSHQVGLASLSADTLYAGTSDIWLLTIDIPQNGYEGDTLTSLSIKDYAVDFAPGDFAAVRLYRDDGNTIFDPGTDTPLGVLAYSGDRHEISGLSEALTGSTRFFIAVDVDPAAVTGHHSRPGVPVDGIDVVSGNDGPTDAALVSGKPFIIINVETIDIAGLPLTPMSTHPGDRDIPLLSLSIANHSLQNVELDTLTLINTSTGPGAQIDLDNTLAAVNIYKDNGNGTLDGSDVLLVEELSFAGGLLTALDVNFDFTPGETKYVLVTADIDSTCARDGDIAQIELATSGGLGFDKVIPVVGAFPLATPTPRDIDGMMAFQVAIYPRTDSLVVASGNDLLMLDFGIPANGYEVDTLTGLYIENQGTATTEHFDTLTLYSDGGDGVFDAGQGDDVRIGDLIEDLAKPGGRAFKTDALSVPLIATCGNHTRFYLVSDIDLDYSVGGSIQFSIPTMGIVVASDDDGPIDSDVMDPVTQLIPKPDGLTVFPYSVGDKSVYAMSTDNLNYGVGFYNGYAVPLLLDEIKLFQIGTATASNIDSLYVYADVDSNGLFDPALDIRLTSLPSNGATFTFSDLNLDLLPRSVSYIFVSYDVPLASTDGVSVDLQLFDVPSLIVQPAGIDILGEFPINSPGVDITDGMIAAQIATSTAPAVTAAANDLDVLATSMTIPSNGIRTDVLNTVEVRNTGTAAVGTDITGMRLWKETGGNPVEFDPSDDTPLGWLVWNGSTWASTLPISEPIPLSGLRTYVTFTVSATPTDGATVQVEIPIGGIQVESGNDGPIDRPITNPALQEISTDPLIATLTADRATYTVGQSIALTMRVRNEGADTLTGVTPSALSASGSGGVIFSSGPTPVSLDLLPGQDTTFVWAYVAQAAGDVELCASARTADNFTVSQSSCTGVFEIQNRASGIPVAISNLAPATANRDQNAVRLFDLTIDYQSGDTTSAPLDVGALRITVEDGSGAPIPPNQIMENAILTDQNGTPFVLSVVDSTNPLDLVLQNPITIQPGEVATIVAECDIVSLAGFTPFRVRIEALGNISIVDSNDGAVVTATSSNSFPWQSTLITINTPADSLLVASTSGRTIHANTGQNDLAVFSVDLLSPGTPNTAREILTDLTFGFADTTGMQIVPNSVIRQITLRSGPQTLAISNFIPSTGSSVDINLATPLILTPGVQGTIDVLVDLRNLPMGDGFQLHIDGPAAVVARDINTSKLVTVAAPNPASQDFPIGSDIIVFQSAASGMLASYVDRMPQSLLPSTTGIPVMDITLTHPDSSASSSLQIDSMSLEFRTSSGSPLYPGDYFSSLTIMNGADTVSVVSSLSSITSIAECAFVTPVPIDPATSEILSVYLTSKSFLTSGDLEIRLDRQDLAVFDTNDGGRITVISGAFPFVAGPADLLLQSNQVLVGLTSRLPANVSALQTGTPAFDLLIQNGAAQGLTDTGARTLRVEVQDPQGAVMDPTELLSGAALSTSAGTTVDGVVGSTEIVFNVPDGVVITPSGQTDTLGVTLDIQTDLGNVNFRLALADATSIDVVELGTQSAVSVATINGQDFPLYTNFGHILGTSVESSFTNYPNPFAAGREGTTITYYLDQRSTVTLRLFTLWGAPVKTLLDGQTLDAGLHQNTVWDGRNGGGDTVNNGVYHLVLEINAVNGSHKTIRRKVGVIR